MMLCLKGDTLSKASLLVSIDFGVVHFVLEKHGTTVDGSEILRSPVEVGMVVEIL